MSIRAAHSEYGSGEAKFRRMLTRPRHNFGPGRVAVIRTAVVTSEGGRVYEWRSNRLDQRMKKHPAAMNYGVLHRVSRLRKPLNRPTQYFKEEFVKREVREAVCGCAESRSGQKLAVGDNSRLEVFVQASSPSVVLREFLVSAPGHPPVETLRVPHARSEAVRAV